MLDALLDRATANPPLPQGGIILAATPLGNPLDASINLIAALASADVIAAEDTRRTRALAENLGVTIRARIVSNFDHNEQQRAESLVDLARAGKRVLVVTDAGMPGVSDPGYPIVLAAIAAGVPLTCLPGPSAVPTALVLSGVGMGHFAFLGFAPRKDGARRTFFSDAAQTGLSVCFFESPHRIADTLRVAAEVYGPETTAAVCRELTKTYEEVARGTLGELAEWAEAGVRGEICVVIDAADASATYDEATAITAVEERVETGMRLKAAVAEIAAASGMGKKALYDAVVAARQTRAEENA